jgi:hypothetical protein
MVPLTPEYQDYKERTLKQLLANLPLLEAKLAEEDRPGVANSLEKQVADIQAHISRLQQELVQGAADESVADDLCQRIARALSKNKFHLAKRYLHKLETIEPFYPGIERLRTETESERASRRTRSIAEGNAPPYGAAAFAAGVPFVVTQQARPALTTGSPIIEPGLSEKGGITRFFEFHIVISCLVVSLIVCVMTGMGGLSLLEWLIEGN